MVADENSLPAAEAGKLSIRTPLVSLEQAVRGKSFLDGPLDTRT